MRDHSNDLYEKVSYRVPAKFRAHLDDILSGKIPGKNEIFTKIRFLTERFPGIPENNLLSLASEMILIHEPGVLDEKYLDSDFIAWSAADIEGERIFYYNWSDLDRKFDTESGYPKIDYPIYILQTQNIAQLLYYEPQFSRNILMALE